MTTSTIPSTAPDQLAQRSAPTDDTFAVVFGPGGPLQKMPIGQLLAKLVATDLCKASKALLDADLAHAADSVALVFNDPTAIQNGWYRKTGASGAGAWSQFEVLTKAVRDEVLAARDAAITAGVAAESSANFRSTIAEALDEFAVGTYFTSTDTGGATSNPNTLRRYKRISGAPGWQDQGNAAAPSHYRAPGTGAVDRTVGNVLDGSVRVDDYPTVQAAADYAASSDVTGPPITPGSGNTTQRIKAKVEFGAKIYPLATPAIHYWGQVWEGQGCAETASQLNTKLYPAKNIDGIRTSGNLYGGNNFTNGKIEDLTIMGPGEWDAPNLTTTAAVAAQVIAGTIVPAVTPYYFTSVESGRLRSYQAISTAPYYQETDRGWFPYGWGINWVSEDGSTEYMTQGQTTVRRVTVRNQPSGALRQPRGGLQTVYEDCTSLTNGGYGLYLKTPFNTSQQSIVVSRFSADSSTGGAAIFLSSPNVGGHTSFRDIKSEANVNNVYGDITTFTASCSGTALTTTSSQKLWIGAVVYAADGTLVGHVQGGAGTAWTVNPGGTFVSQTMTARSFDQRNAMRIENAAAGATVKIEGLTHIAAGPYFTGGTNLQMPGSAIVLKGPNTPNLEWNNVQIRVLSAQTDFAESEFTGGCTATISAGVITAISQPTAVGIFPTGTVPLVDIIGDGTGATATAAVVNGRTVVTLTNGGTGYTYATVILRGPPAVIVDLTYGQRIDRKFVSGRWSDTPRIDACRSSTTPFLYGTACDWISPSVEGPAFQFSGSTPALILYATGAAADQRKVMLINSGGAGSYRTVTDAGVSTIAWQVNNTSGVSGSMEINAVLRPSTDNNRTLGSSSFRWSTVYAGTGTINTSDEHEKHWLGAPDEAFKRAMLRIKSEIGLYQWNDAVAEKGEAGARIHVGVRAQRALSIAIEEGVEAEPCEGWRDAVIDPIAKGSEFTLEEWEALAPFEVPERPIFRHAMFCCDVWDRQWQDIEGHVEVGRTPVAIDEDGNLTGNKPIMEPQVVGKRLIEPGGRRFGIRADQMLFAMMGAL